MVPSEAKKVSGYVLFNIHPTISLKKKKKKDLNKTLYLP